MTISLDNAIDRMVELQIASLATLSITADAVPYFFHTQEAFPYWTNRVGTITIPYIGGGGEDLDTPTYTVISRLVIAHLTADYVGINEDKLKTWIPVIIRYFHARPWLETATQTSGLDQLLFARITDCTGFRVFQSSGAGASQVGCEFTHRLDFEETVNLISG